MGVIQAVCCQALSLNGLFYLEIIVIIIIIIIIIIIVIYICRAIPMT